MNRATKLLIGAWLLFVAGLLYALIVPVGEASITDRKARQTSPKRSGCEATSRREPTSLGGEG